MVFQSGFSVAYLAYAGLARPALEGGRVGHGPPNFCQFLRSIYSNRTVSYSYRAVSYFNRAVIYLFKIASNQKIIPNSIS